MRAIASRRICPGGAPAGILPASMDDIPLDFGTLEKLRLFMLAA
jgi:formate dehydrogenase